MGKFKIGDKATVTETIRRKDGRAVVHPGHTVTIIDVSDTTSGNQIVSI
jgi:hypothetical protein